MMIRHLFILILVFSSCQEKKEVIDSGVRVIGSDLFNKTATVEVIGGNDLGEIKLGSDAKKITIKVTNNSSEELAELALNIDFTSNGGMKFAGDGINPPTSPGFEGTCQSILETKQSCLFIVNYNPTVQDQIEQKFKLQYKTKEEEKGEEFSIVALTGEEGKLEFTSGQSLYNNGLKERTDRTLITEEIDIRNIGFLPARSINMILTNSGGSDAYKLIANTCPEVLKNLESCKVTVQYQSLNHKYEKNSVIFNASAPDGDADVDYHGELQLSYNGYYLDGTKSLVAFFDTRSVTIAGKLSLAGNGEISFVDTDENTIVAGNVLSQIVPVINSGFKEAIIKQIDIRDASQNVVANCYNENSTYLNCYNVGDTSLTTNLHNNLMNNPFKIEDMNSCVIKKENINYTRLSDKTIDIPSLKQIGGGDGSSAGETCFFRFSFQPSVSHITAVDFSNYEVSIIYDSTWKNEIFINGDNSADPYLFRAISAEFHLPARLELNGSDFASKVLSINADTYPVVGVDEFCDMNEVANACDAKLGTAPSSDASLNADQIEMERYRCFDIGRLALSSSNSFKRETQITFKNIGEYEATGLEYTDGSGNNVLSSAANLNTFYESLRHDCSPSLRHNRDGGGGFCSILYNLTPVDQGLSATNDGLMFDNPPADSTSPHFYKQFSIAYDDGAAVNDDGSSRAKRKLHFKIRAKLAGKGFLNFKTHTPISVTLVAGNEHYEKVEIENVGTSPVKSIQVDPTKTGVYSSGGAINEIDIVPSTYSGLEKDCYHDIEGLGGAQNTSVILNPGDSCFVMYKIQADNTLRAAPGSYYKHFKSSFDNTSDLLGFDLPDDTTARLSFLYYDNDVAGRCSSNPPADAIYGDQTSIVGANVNNYQNQNYLHVEFASPGVLVPFTTVPTHSSYTYRRPFDYPAFGGVIAGSLSAMYVPLDGVITGSEEPAFFKTDDKDFDLNTGNLNGIGRISDDNQAYTFFAGSFPADNRSYGATISFITDDTIAASNASMSYISGDPEITASISGSTLTASFNSSSSILADKLYERVVEIQYEDSSYDFPAITDYEFNLMGSLTPKIVSYQMKIVFKAVKDSGDIRFKVRDYEILDTDGTPTGSTYYFSTTPNLFTDSALMTFTSVKGSTTVARKRITLENIGGKSISDLRFFDLNNKEYIEATDPVTAPEGFYIFDHNCSLSRTGVGVSLDEDGGAQDECYIDIAFKPLTIGGQASGYFKILYDLGNGEYVDKRLRYTMESTEPAKIQGLGLALDAVETKVPTNPYLDGHIIDIGDVEMLGLTWTNQYTFTIENTSLINASLRASLDGTTLDDLRNQVITADWTELRTAASVVGTRPISTTKLKVEAHRDCFGTTDENTGFNSSANTCSIRATINIDKDDFLLDIDAPERLSEFGYKFFTYDFYFTLDYFSYKRESISKDGNGLTFGFSGNFLPKDSTAVASEITSVDAIDNGDLSFEWGSFNDTNDSDWGNITSYRVFYDVAERANRRVYGACNPGNCIETAGQSFSMVGLEIGKTYYIYVVPKRTYAGKTYVSDAPAMKFTVLIPPSNTFYVYDEDILLDKFLESGDNNLTLPQANAVCSGAGKSLITTQILNNHLLGNSEASIYNMNNHYHWLNDAAQDIQTIVTNAGYSYSCSAAAQAFNSDSFKYEKDCSSCGCDSLNKLYGGFFLEQDYTFYTYATSPKGSARCYTDNAASKY